MKAILFTTAILLFSTVQAQNSKEILSTGDAGPYFIKELKGEMAQQNYGSQCILWGDFNNDDVPDIYSVYDQGLFTHSDSGFNKTGITFESAKSGSWIDFNNDGLLDLFLVDPGAWRSDEYGNMLFKNLGSNEFNMLEIVDTDYRTEAGVWADVNNDGLLDVFLSFLDTGNGNIYLNNGDDSFIEDQELEQVLGFPSFSDFDMDGDPDLFIFTEWGHKLFINDGNGAFTEDTNNQITKKSMGTIGASWGDVDNDGDIDVFIANGGDSEEDNALYLNQGDGSFIEVQEGVLVSDGGKSFGSAFGDIDNDGDLDLVVANKEDNFLYMGNGDGTFSRVEKSIVDQDTVSGYDGALVSYACAFADYTLDGFQDLLVSNGNVFSSLFTNLGNDNHWLKLKLIGKNSNASGIGARISLYSGGSVHYREVNLQSGFWGQNDRVQHFGLGGISQVDSLVIRWPSGAVQRSWYPVVDQTLTFQEYDNTSILDNGIEKGLNIYPIPANKTLNVEWNNGKSVTVLLSDLSGRVVYDRATFNSACALDVEYLQPGIYVVQFQSGSQIVSQKIIID